MQGSAGSTLTAGARLKGRGQRQDWDVKDLVAQGVLEHGGACRARGGFSQEWYCRRPEWEE